MSERLFLFLKIQSPFVAGSVGTEADILFGPIRETQFEAMVFLDSRSDGRYLGVVAEVAEKMGLLLLPDVVGDMSGYMRVGLDRTALILKPPEPEM
jgi:hypothetical protein